MEHGIVQDWNDMEQIWQYIYSKDQLQTFAEEVCALALNISPFMRECTTILIGEHNFVKFIFVPLKLFSSRTSFFLKVNYVTPCFDLSLCQE